MNGNLIGIDHELLWYGDSFKYVNSMLIGMINKCNEKKYYGL